MPASALARALRAYVRHAPAPSARPSSSTTSSTSTCAPTPSTPPPGSCPATRSPSPPATSSSASSTCSASGSRTCRPSCATGSAPGTPSSTSAPTAAPSASWPPTPSGPTATSSPSNPTPVPRRPGRRSRRQPPHQHPHRPLRRLRHHRRPDPVRGGPRQPRPHHRRPPRHVHATVEVPSAPLADLVGRADLATTRVIKIDVEGAEAARSADFSPHSRTCTTTPSSSSRSPRLLAKQGESADAIIATLREHGFHPYTLTNDYDPATYPGPCAGRSRPPGAPRPRRI